MKNYISEEVSCEEDEPSPSACSSASSSPSPSAGSGSGKRVGSNSSMVSIFQVVESLALCLETLLSDKLLGIDFLGRTDGIHTTISYLDARIYRIGEQDQLAVWILAQEVLMALGGIHRESLDVWITIVVGIIEDGSPYLVLVPFLQTQDVVLVMVVRVEVGDVELAVVEYHQDRFIVIEIRRGIDRSHHN